MIHHQYIDRESHRVMTENLYGNQAVRFLYSELRENAPAVFRLLTSARASKWLGYLNYESYLGEIMSNNGSFLKSCGINGAECVEDPRRLDTLQKIFERKIRYWECRPMPKDPGAVVSPADSRMLYGSLSDTSSLFIKGKFFDFEELIGRDKKTWLHAFSDGDFAIFRLTPEKYHYNHTPVSGKVIDFYKMMGTYHSCNPYAVLNVVTPYSKNKRIVTVFDTDVPGGTHVGLVAMIEVVALMIGGIVQCYSKKHYIDPMPIGTGLFVDKGLPKSLFRPGSSTVVLMFEKNRIRFADDIVANMSSFGVESIFSQGFGRPMVETDVKVRSLIGSITSCTQEENSHVQ
jgi:phosphatidylserine decarboxylase